MSSSQAIKKYLFAPYLRSLGWMNKEREIFSVRVNTLIPMSTITPGSQVFIQLDFETKADEGTVVFARVGDEFHLAPYMGDPSWELLGTITTIWPGRQLAGTSLN